MKIARRAVVPLLLAPSCLLGQSNASDQEWAAFVAWVKALPAGTVPNTRTRA